MEILRRMDNPFTIKPVKDLVGVEDLLKKILSHISSGNIILLKGEMGTGKTSMLYWLRDKLKKKYKIIWIPSHLRDFDEIYSYINSRSFSFIEKLFGEKKIVLFVDEAQRLEFDTVDNIRSLWDEGKVHSILFSGTDLNMSYYLKDRIYIFETKKLTNEELKELYKKRTKGRKYFTDKALEIIANLSYGIPRKFLKICNDLYLKYYDNLPIDENIVRKEYPYVPRELKTIEDEIIQILREKGPLTAKEIATYLNLSLQTTWRYLSSLTKAGMIRKEGSRPAKYYI